MLWGVADYAKGNALEVHGEFERTLHLKWFGNIGMRRTGAITIETICVDFQDIDDLALAVHGFKHDHGLTLIDACSRVEPESIDSGLFPASSAVPSITSCAGLHDARRVRSRGNTKFTPNYHAHISKPVQGFTLIEILVVISIISLLMVISFSALRSARHLSQRLRCSTNLKSLTLAALIYAGDNDENLMVKDQGMNPYQFYLGQQREINQGHPDLRDMFDGYLSGFDKHGGASPLMFCPSARPQLDQRRRQISYELASTRWSTGDYVIGYAYWAAIEDNLDAIELDWLSEVEPPSRTTDKPYTPIFSDPLEKHHASPSPYPWGLASHTREGTTEYTSSEPVGQNNARLDGSVRFQRFTENSDWVDEQGSNQFGDLEAATIVFGHEDILLLWGGAG